MAMTESISIQIPSEYWGLIDKAAAVAGKNRAAFILEHAVRGAEETLLDQTDFSLSSEQWQVFTTALDTPATINPALKKLLAVAAPWETP